MFVPSMNRLLYCNKVAAQYKQLFRLKCSWTPAHIYLVASISCTCADIPQTAGHHDCMRLDYALPVFCEELLISRVNRISELTHVRSVAVLDSVVKCLTAVTSRPIVPANYFQAACWPQDVLAHLLWLT